MGIYRTTPTIKIRDYLDKMSTDYMNIYTSNLGTEELDFNIFELYKDEMFNDCIRVELERDERLLYSKDPKRLSNDLWKTPDLFFAILLMNGWDKPEDMDLTTVKYLYVPGNTILSIVTSLIQKKLNGNLPSFNPEE